MVSGDIFDNQLLQKYNGNAPRYTSYPTAAEFHDNLSHEQFLSAISQSGSKNLSLYLHIPFCHSLCYYCACNKIVTRNQDKSTLYIEYLIREMSAISGRFSNHHVKQIHFGGGTPSFLTKDQLTTLMMALRKYFQMDYKPEISIEIDPRGVELDYLVHLKVLGFNRLSLGIQDIDQDVQQAINRVQSTEHICYLIRKAKSIGFTSVNVDLIYGLPKQTQQTFQHTLNKMIALNVDRVSLFSYAHLPSRFAAQRKIYTDWLPSPTYKFALMKLAVQSLTETGYQLIGMDHFAKPTDELAKAAKSGKLHRNFQGYTTLGECDLLGLGVSSISAIGDCYSQNHKKLADYYASMDQYEHGLAKGLMLTKNDQIRADVIKALMCNMSLNISDIEAHYDIHFASYFAKERQRLEPFVEDGLLKIEHGFLQIDERARLLVRKICACFDEFLDANNSDKFSQVV